MFVSPPPITNIESLSHSTIPSLGIGSFGRNRYETNIQKRTTLEVDNAEAMKDDIEKLDPLPPQDI